MASKNFSIVEFFNENDGYKCGYCKSKTTNYSHGMWAHQLTVQDYQDLIDRGWRRSGHYCYKPTLSKMCCPTYTIRCDAANFKISKSQKKILKRLNRFLAHGERGKQRINEENNDSECHETEGNPDLLEAQQSAQAHTAMKDGEKVSKVNPSLQHLIAPNFGCDTRSGQEPTSSQSMSSVESKSEAKEGKSSKMITVNSTAEDVLKSSKCPKPGEGPDKGRPPCKKAKLIRLERKQQKLITQGLVPVPSTQKPKLDSTPKTLEDFLHSELPNKPAHRLQVRLLRSQPPSADFKSTIMESLSLYRRYQMTIHGDPEFKCTESQYRRFLVRSPLELKLVSVGSREFTIASDRSWRLFAKYQKAVHRETDEECDRGTFWDFLVASPLKAWRPADGSGPPQGYGSFHQQYWLDDQLIAVGVIDILPRCVSSVYFYYDPQYSDLSLGTYGSLREVAFTRTLSHNCPELQWYCMGFYIHSCPKMRYKAGLSPSMLLCPEAFTWHPMIECIPLLDKLKCSRLNPNKEASDSDTIEDISQVIVLHNQCAMEYRQYCQLKNNRNQDENECVLQYARLVGKTCARRMLLIRQTSNM